MGKVHVWKKRGLFTRCGLFGMGRTLRVVSRPLTATCKRCLKARREGKL